MAMQTIEPVSKTFADLVPSCLLFCADDVHVLYFRIALCASVSRHLTGSPGLMSRSIELQLICMG